MVALTVSIIAYLLLHLTGDPAVALAGEGASEADIAMIRQTYGFDRPLLVQYGDWLWQIIRGELGTSVYFKTPVAPLVFSKLETTLLLAVSSLGVALVISVPLGILAAIYKTAGLIGSVSQLQCSVRLYRISFSPSFSSCCFQSPGVCSPYREAVPGSIL